MIRVSEHVWLVDTRALGDDGDVAAYLVKGSRRAMLVDAGYASSSSVLLGELAEAGAELGYIFPTHVHLDHCGGAGEVAGAYSGAEVLAQERGARHLADPSRLLRSAGEVYGAGQLALMGIPRPVDPSRISAFKEEAEVDLGGVSVTLLHTPGHAPHHASAYVEPDRVILSGDALSSRAFGGRIVIPPTSPPSFDLGEYARSLRRLEALGARAALLAHFGPVEIREGFFGAEEERARSWVAEASALAEEVGAEEAAARIASALAEEVGLRELPRGLKQRVRVSVLGAVAYARRSSDKF